MQISGPGLQELSKCVLSTCLLTINSQLQMPPSHPDLEPNLNTGRSPDKPCVAQLCPSSCSEPRPEPPPPPRLREDPLVLQDSTQTRPPPKAITEPLTLTWAKRPLVNTLTYRAGMTAIILIIPHCKCMLSYKTGAYAGEKQRLWGHWARVQI